MRIAAPTLLITLLFCVAAPAMADDQYKTHRVKIKKHGAFYFDAPESWGIRPKREGKEGVSQARFGPFGTEREPIFMATITAAVSDEPVTEEKAKSMIEGELENYRKVAFETDIEINRFEGKHTISHYFTLTDSEKKPFEYQYLTLVISY